MSVVRNTRVSGNESAEIYFSQFSEMLDQTAEYLPWHLAARHKSLHELRQLGLPLSHNEHWKYSRVRDHLATLADTGAAAPSGHMPFSPADVLTIEICGERVKRTELPAGLSVEAFSSNNETVVTQYMNHSIDGSRYPLALLNSALLQRGFLIHLDRGCRMERPINLVFRDNEHASLQKVFVRVLLVLEADSHLQMIEQTECYPGCLNLVRQCTLARAAELELSLLQLPHQSRIWNLTTADLDQGSQFELNLAGFGGYRQRNEISVRMRGSDTATDIRCMLYAQNKEKLDTQICVEHLGKDSRSRQLVRAMAQDSAEITVNGRIHIHPDAQRSDARLSNANLLLHAGARINSKPELEIYADDVQCAHGATVGQLDEEQIFYLRSRGLNEIQARAILGMAFMRSSMANELMRDIVQDRLSELLLT